jgi:hypothetical protein
LNENLLFHGTSNADPSLIYDGEIGFDYRVGHNEGLYGKGSYFALKANYSNEHFAHYTKSGSKILIVAKVLAGRPFISIPL